MEYKKNSSNMVNKFISLSKNKSSFPIVNNSLHKTLKSNQNTHLQDLDHHFKTNKYEVPKTIINLNQIPKVRKPVPLKLDHSFEKLKFNLLNFNLESLNKNFQSQQGSFSPKIKYKHTKLKNFLNENEEQRKIINQSRINNTKGIIDFSEIVSFPLVSVNRSQLTEDSNTPFFWPKTKKFVTISFNQMMLKNVAKNKNPQKNLENLNFISLNELNKKLLL